MNEKEQLSLIFKELGKYWGFDDFDYKDHGPNTLLFNDTMMIHFKQSDNLKKLMIFVNLGLAYSETESIEDKFNKLHKILHANLLWKDTCDGTLGLKNSGDLIFSYQAPISTLTAQGLESLLDAFVNQAAKLKEMLIEATIASEDITFDISAQHNVNMLKV